jgi:hypothetical protein
MVSHENTFLYIDYNTIDVYRVIHSFYLRLYTYMNLGEPPEKAEESRMIIKRGKFGRLKRLTLLQITLTFRE